MISKWRFKGQPADSRPIEEWKLQRTLRGLRPQEGSGTWPGRPRGGLAGAAKGPTPKSYLWPFTQDLWEKYLTKGLCYGCGGDWDFKGALKVDINSSEYTGYSYLRTKPGYRRRSRSCEDARFIHINFVLLAEVKHFEKVSLFHYITF